ncbi:hypothetical protein Ciccas_014560 [Cichlidogyrus casuarinus]|uniref:Uncharacterized protein n=1 Tax=Cichlidogyrus casuarinus TaxID=1844966 RepID=A0ABD2PKN0_9PLAT
MLNAGGRDEYLRPRIHLEKSIDRYDLSEDKWEEAGTCQMVRQEASVACVSANSTQPRSSSLASCLNLPSEGIQSVEEEVEDGRCLSTRSSISAESRSRSICLSESTNWPDLRKIRTKACEWTVVELGGMSEPSPEETDGVRFRGLDQISMYRVSEDLTVHCTEQFIKLPRPIRFTKCILREDTGLVYIFTETDSKLSVLDLKRNSLRPLNSLGDELCEGAAQNSSNARIHCGASWMEDRLYIYGGFSELIGPEHRPANARDDLYCFNPSTNVW